jgi:hypothetical protein
MQIKLYVAYKITSFACKNLEETKNFLKSVLISNNIQFRVSASYFLAETSLIILMDKL